MAVCRGHARRLAVTLVTLAATACGGTAADPGSDAGGDSSSDPGQRAGSRGGDEAGTPSPSPPTPTADVTTETTIAPERRPITIAFAGDVHFEGRLRERLDDPRAALDPIAAELSAADLTIVNLETAVGAGGAREPKRYAFQAPPSALEALAAAGIDVITMANNHAADFGLDGLNQALAATADPPPTVVGIGADTDDAFAPALVDIDGTTVAVLGASAADHDPTADPTGHWAARDDRPGTADAIDPGRLVEAVKAASAEADVVVTYLHWGIQGESCPSEDQTELAAVLASAGADIVVGAHAHRLQGAGMLGDTYVAYGLGNFAWYTQASEATTTTGVLTLTVADGTVVDESWAPASIRSSGLPEFAAGSDADQLTDAFHDLRDCTDLAEPPH
jgi:poly-gamma-glutamate capsule biosynthesis protein CapA/YwtB (metallophosphatase superfamily)